MNSHRPTDWERLVVAVRLDHTLRPEVQWTELKSTQTLLQASVAHISRSTCAQEDQPHAQAYTRTAQKVKQQAGKPVAQTVTTGSEL